MAKMAAEVEEGLAILESGQRLPPNPREAGRPREDGRAFRARMDKLRARYEAQFLKRSQRKVCNIMAALQKLKPYGQMPWCPISSHLILPIPAFQVSCPLLAKYLITILTLPCTRVNGEYSD